jgi:hypothetical protein
VTKDELLSQASNFITWLAISTITAMVKVYFDVVLLKEKLKEMQEKLRFLEEKGCYHGYNCDK